MDCKNVYFFQIKTANKYYSPDEQVCLYYSVFLFILSIFSVLHVVQRQENCSSCTTAPLAFIKMLSSIKTYDVRTVMSTIILMNEFAL